MRSNLHITFGGGESSRHTYACVAVRRDDHWVVTCDEYSHVQSRARLLASAAKAHRASLAAAVGVPEATVTVTVYPVLPRRVHELVDLWRDLREMATWANQAAALTHQAIARALAAEQLSLRDIGTILGVSFQRAHQLITHDSGGER